MNNLSGLLVDSGERVKCDTGSVRERYMGKGRCDLLPIDVIKDIVSCNRKTFKNGPKWIVINDLLEYCSTLNSTLLLKDIEIISGLICERDENYGSREDNFANALLVVSRHFELGLTKYPERNWEKGMPVKWYIDSAIRHMLKCISNWEDEPHLDACLWNIMCAYQTAKWYPKMLDDFVIIEK